MKKAIFATQLFILFILTGCALPTPTSKPSLDIKTVKKLPEKVIYDRKEELLLNIDVKHLLTLKNNKQLSEYVKVHDRKGKLVTHLPVENGQIAVFMDFTPNLLELRYKGKDVPISIVVYHVCDILKKDIITSKVQSSFKKFNSVDELLIEKICWNDSSYSWEFKFKSKRNKSQGFVYSK